MDLHIDPRQSVPIYAQIVEQVRSLVLAGALHPGDRVPSVRDLAVAHRVNRNTVAKAYGALEADGVLETRRGEGTFVAAAPTTDDRADLQRRVDTFVERVVAEAAGLGLGAGELSERIAKARRAPKRASNNRTGASS